MLQSKKFKVTLTDYEYQLLLELSKRSGQPMSKVFMNVVRQLRVFDTLEGLFDLYGFSRKKLKVND